MAVVHPPGPGALSTQERRELAETAQVFEMIVEANPLEVGALEALREIYVKLGDLDKHADVARRIAEAHGTAPDGNGKSAESHGAPAEIPDAPPAPAARSVEAAATTASVHAPAVAPAPPPRPAERAPAAPPAPTGRAGARRSELAAAPAPAAASVASQPSAPSAPSPAPRPAVPAPVASPFAASGKGKVETGPVTGRMGRLGDLLLAGGHISRAQLDQALESQRGSGEKIGAVLTRLGFLTEEQLTEFLSKQYGIPSTSLSQLDIDTDVVSLVPAQIARKYEVLAIKREGNALTLAMSDPTNVFALDDVAFMTGLTVVPVVAPQSAIRKAFEQHYEAEASGIAAVITEMAQAALGDVEVVEGEEEAWAKADVFELKESADEPPVVRLINMILVDAIRRGASDIHLEPYEQVFRVRFRVDGVLHEIMTPPKRMEAALTSRVKIMASLDIAERRLPQDGRIKLRYHQREIDFRVSTLPTIFGEKTVMRILDKESLQLDLTMLGFDPWSLEHFTKAIHQPYGMILITGPTGSGKTTTLYSAIHTINSPDINIMTAEDPVEYNLKGVNQVQVNDEIGRTFAAALRSFLRQDPDVILVGETRDVETAQIGIRAALTGHLVLTTLHTNDCPSSVARLLDMGIPPFLVASALLLILAQRLARRVCTECKEAYD
ncbi:MAG TPA: ATPase, T2SS/T4P/T4SS family, partial [Methylomirabilota bacterium]|nr:ATPase, T2SS/T4P/T4SS family [Methylomirabilota bacterium]